MSWYRTGTVTVTNGSTTVTGSGTAWVANSRVGDAFVGPDGLTYEITNIASNTAISILPAYRSASGSGQSYSIIPVQGYTKTLADQASDLVNSYDKPWNVADDAAEARSDLGLGSAATRNVGTVPGNVMEVGAGGWIVGNEFTNLNFDTNFNNSIKAFLSGVGAPSAVQSGICLTLGGRTASQNNNRAVQLFFNHVNGVFVYRAWNGSSFTPYITPRTTLNTTVDSNGFIKSASPIINLYADKIEMNDEAKQQNIKLVVNGVGDYTITGTSGFAQEGWYIETPKDANGNIKCFVEYEQIEQSNGTYTIYVKTFEPDYYEGPAKAGVPKHIPEGRWIDIRLQPLTASDQGDQVGNDSEN